MATIKYVNPTIVQDVLLDKIATATKIILLKSYAVTDSYTTVTTTNNIAEVTLNSGHFAKSNGTAETNGANKRVLTITPPALTASQTLAAGSDGGAIDLHVALVDGTNILYVTNESSNPAVTSGNTVNLSAFAYTMTQPA